ncbi:MAG: rod shape-determining protein MreD [Candidatus Omnitrophota bacterium]
MYRIGALTLFIFTVIAGLIQMTAFDYIGFFGIKPDLLLITVVFFSLSCTRNISIKSALIAGFIKDITSSATLGNYALSFLLAALLLNYYQRRIYREAAHTQVMVNFLSYLLMSAVVIMLNLVSSETHFSYYPYLGVVFKGALYTGLVSPLVFFIYSRVLRIHLAPTFF